jgi:uroporphyrinogen-III decarboxylase
MGELGALVVPDPHGAERRFAQVSETARQVDRSQTFLAVGHPHAFYEKAIETVSAGEFLSSLLCEPDRAHALLDIFLQFELGIAAEYAPLTPDHVNIGDDYGTQDQLAMSPDTWREFFKPRLRAIIDFYRRNVGEHVVVSHHSCGHVMPILEDLIEIGVNILHPVQSTANDLAELRRITSGRLVLAGGIDGQRILPLGTPEEVREEVFRKMALLWEDGGYLPMPEKMLGVPQENHDAMVKAIADWSREHVECRQHTLA